MSSSQRNWKHHIDRLHQEQAKTRAEETAVTKKVSEVLDDIYASVERAKKWPVEKEYKVLLESGLGYQFDQVEEYAVRKAVLENLANEFKNIWPEIEIKEKYQEPCQVENRDGYWRLTLSPVKIRSSKSCCPEGDCKSCTPCNSHKMI